MMQPVEPGARPTADSPAIHLQRATAAADLQRASSYLDAREAEAGVPLVDEAERERLRRAVRGEAAPDGHWHVVLALRGDQVVGYGALSGPVDAHGVVIGDVCVPVSPQLRGAVRSALLGALITFGSDIEATRLQVWMRHVADVDVTGAQQDGFRVARRLGILGRTLEQPVEIPPAQEVTVRAYRPDTDDAATVDVLAGAYEGTDDGGWTLEQFAERRDLPWFRPEDLLLAEADDGRVLGLHWLKRREPTVGEVYNLAIHPDGQGRGLGPLLLATGLAHLRATGCHDVLLWVDRGNDRAVRLYTGQGFTTRWDDVALEYEFAG